MTTPETLNGTLEEFSANVQVLSVKPGDVLVLMTDKHLTRPQVESMSELLKRVIPQGVKAIVLDGGLKLGLLQSR